MQLPEYLKQGEPARLFPVLSTTSKEGRTTSIVLACIAKIRELGEDMLGSAGHRLGKRSKIETFTEVTFKGQKTEISDRPDGLIVVTNGSRVWRALVEAKVANSQLSADQIERYRTLAKENGVDCVITISNQFSTTVAKHPLQEVRKSRSKTPVYHWSWMYVLTCADLLINTDQVADEDQKILLEELKRFLSHESAGIKGFDRMPPEWTELNKLVSAGGAIPAKSEAAQISIEAWHQETKDLSLILSRATETNVTEKLSKKHKASPMERLKEEHKELRDSQCLFSALEIPDAAAPLEIKADIMRRSIDVGMTLRAPEDKKSSKARVNWLLRQIKTENLSDLYVRLNWPGRSEATQHSLQELMDDVSICEEGKENLSVVSFHIFISKRLGARFTQQGNFISDLETIVPKFYRDVGQTLIEWRKKAPQLKTDDTLTEESSAM